MHYHTDNIKLSWRRKGWIFCANTELSSNLPNNPPTVASIRHNNNLWFLPRKDWFMPMWINSWLDSCRGVLHAAAAYYISQIFGGLIIKRWRNCEWVWLWMLSCACKVCGRWYSGWGGYHITPSHISSSNLLSASIVSNQAWDDCTVLYSDFFWNTAWK